MGAPAALIVADVIMEEFLDKCLDNLTVKPKLIIKIVDDQCPTVKYDHIQNTLTD